MLIEPQFDGTFDFIEGVARVVKGGKLGLINKEGEILIEPQFDDAFDLIEGVAPVQKAGRSGAISIRRVTS